MCCDDDMAPNSTLFYAERKQKYTFKKSRETIFLNTTKHTRPKKAGTFLSLALPLEASRIALVSRTSNADSSRQYFYTHPLTNHP